ncbi:MAG: RNA-binding protein [Oscillospiraceae bacterium]|nr:RNA-binding protein [Oscillospiraceae bacterium]
MPKKKKDETTDNDVENNIIDSLLNTAGNESTITDSVINIADSKSNITDSGNDITEDKKDEVEVKKTKSRTTVRGRDRPPPILAIENGGEVEIPEDRDKQAWLEIKNARKTNRIMSGILSGIEMISDEYNIAVVDYRRFRIAIPINDMIDNNELVDISTKEDIMVRKSKVVGNMLGAEVDFIVKGIDSRTRSVVASRVEAMRKKRRLFYMTPDSSGRNKIYEGRDVQARVIAVAEKSIWIEAFGVTCPIFARDLAKEWIGNAAEKFSIGDTTVVRIKKIYRDKDDNISINAEIKSITENMNSEIRKKCQIQGKYAGYVKDIYDDVYIIRLAIGVDAVAHSCYNNRLPCKNDRVCFTVTHFDDERNEAVGIISKVIKSKYT